MTGTGKNVTINLSPQSHDRRVSKLAGRGTYSMDQMEAWIPRALAKGISRIEVYFFIGMPEQGHQSVRDTVEYCGQLMERFKGEQVVPIVCPMFPILDPASDYFVNPRKWGYRVINKTVDQHRSGMSQISLIDRINYETKWLSRSELVYTSYRAIRDLHEMKADVGMFPRGVIDRITRRLDEALDHIKIVHEFANLYPHQRRADALAEIRGETKRLNNELFFGGVVNQAMPVRRKIGGRWYDEIPFDDTYIRSFGSTSDQG